MNKSIAIVQFARLQSERIPNKMLQVVGGLTLIERACEYMLKVKGLRQNVDCYLIVPDSDGELVRLIDKPQYQGIKLRLMNPDQSSGRIWPELIKPFIHELKEYDWVWDANIACHPFLKLQTGLDIVDNLQGATPSGTLMPSLDSFLDCIVYAIEERNILWDQMLNQTWPRVDKKAQVIRQDDGRYWFSDTPETKRSYQMADTKHNPSFLKPSHIAHCYRPQALEYSEQEIAFKLSPVAINLTREEQIDIDTPADLEMAQRLAPHHYIIPQLDAIAMGTGPSFFKWASEYQANPLTYPIPQKEQEPPHSVRSDGPKVWHPSLYGCGVTPLYINNIRYYGYGDIVHIRNVPDGRLSDPHHPGCITYAGTRNLEDKKPHGEYTPPLLKYSDLDLPHGESSGGMAISMACLHHDVVGIIGFDGNRDGFGSDEVYENFVIKTRTLINYWQNRGRRIISLMPNSVFNSIVEPAIVPLKYRELGRVV